MYKKSELKRALKTLDAQIKKFGNISTKLTHVQRHALLEMFGKWKSQSFKPLPTSQSYYNSGRVIGSINDVQNMVNNELDAAQKFVTNEQLDVDTVICRMTCGNNLRVSGCLPMSDGALAVKYTNRFKKREKAKKAAMDRVKKNRAAAKRVVQATTLKDVAKLIKQLKSLQPNVVIKSAAKKKVKKTKAIKQVKIATPPMEQFNNVTKEK